MSTRPDLSPAMLKAFMRIRFEVAHLTAPEPCGFQATAKRERKALRAAASVRHVALDFAWMGQLCNFSDRAKLWTAFGYPITADELAAREAQR